ncbi:hypothetical protein HGB25_03250, partial [Candidatus Saccharibacteria bacterium]|nr:hypothetical protein [Candidatus Saccharibacteria bacterium]
ARAKAEVTWATRRPSREVQQTAPHLYEAEDTKWGGSVIREDLIVAFSGVQAIFDEMIAGWLADAIIALAREQMELIMAHDGSYVGDYMVA